MSGIAIAFVIYFLAIVVIAIYTMRGIGSTTDFLLGGRKIGVVGTAISAAASAHSASAVVGHAGLAFLMGFQAAWIVFASTMLEYLAMLYFLGPKLRRFSERRDAITIPEYLESRFRDSHNLLRVTCAIALIMFMIPYVVSQYVGMSFAISQVLDWPLVPAVILAAVITAVYTMVGGYRAVVYTDVMQGFLMIMAMLVIPLLAWKSAGGLTNVVRTLDEIGGADLTGIIGSGGLPFAIGMLFSGLGAFGNPHIIVRYMSVRSTSDLKLAAFVNLIFNLIINWGGILLGLAGRVLYRDISQLPFENREMVFFEVSRSMIGSDFIVGIMWAGVFAAMMSSADSMMLVVTSSVGRDIYQKVIKAKEVVREDVLVRLNRVVVLVVVVICLLLTFFMEKSALMIALFAYGGLGGALGPVVLLSLWWKRMTKWGAMAGLLGGIGMAVGWHFTPSLIAIVAYEALPAFLFSMTVAVGVSLVTKPPRDPELESDLRFPGPKDESWDTTVLP
jgi:SSS family solute:Na+ symporter/sodium/proline symporter